MSGAHPTHVLGQYGLTGGCETIEVHTPMTIRCSIGVNQVGSNSNGGPRAMTWNMVVAARADHIFTAVLQVQTNVPDDLPLVSSKRCTAVEKRTDDVEQALRCGWSCRERDSTTNQRTLGVVPITFPGRRQREVLGQEAGDTCRGARGLSTAPRSR